MNGSILIKLVGTKINNIPCYHFDIVDTGCGMSEEKIDRLFSMF